ncbi:MAG: hypothetical protein LBL71_03220 [Endomicrobium sp.]|jgi:hypothetical protein|nr:hypothetical protein [Endomicrobium sp.]
MFLYAHEIVSASLSKDKAYIGDKIEFIVKAELPENSQISAAQNFKFENFEILSVCIEHLPGGNSIYELKFYISAYKTGHLVINPLTVFYINSDGTNNLFFTPEKSVDIQSLVAADGNTSIKDIKPLKKLKIKFFFICAGIAGFMLLMILGVSILKYVRKERKKFNMVVIDDKTAALIDLDALYKNRTHTPVRNFYYKMSEILRRYISKKYKFDAMDMTTYEFFEKTKDLLPDSTNITEFKNYLKVFNLARYACFMPDEKEIEFDYVFTRKLLELI